MNAGVSHANSYLYEFFANVRDASGHSPTTAYSDADSDNSFIALSSVCSDAAPIAMKGYANSQRSIIPSWNGDPAKWKDYGQEVERRELSENPRRSTNASRPNSC